MKIKQNEEDKMAVGSKRQPPGRGDAPGLMAECNVALVGDRGVGKTALVNRVVNGKFSEVSNAISRVLLKLILIGTALKKGSFTFLRGERRFSPSV